MKHPRSHRTYDGILCFGGEDWWYHNRGHFDMQMMKRMSRRMPVIYVNSIGMRKPSWREGRMFLRRAIRKLCSMRRGLVEETRQFSVLSTRVAPTTFATPAAAPSIAHQAEKALQRRSINQPLAWVACPTAAECLPHMPAMPIVYQRTDRYESFTGVNTDRIRACDAVLKEQADLTVFCSRALFDAESGQCRNAVYVEHGVDVERFVKAGDRHDLQPEDVRRLPSPRAGFVGGVDNHTFDQALLECVAAAMPNVHFLIVGAVSLPPGSMQGSNITCVGQKPYEQVPCYMAACDVLIMPWRNNSWIDACNPVKLKEYLAVGRPVVSTPFVELAEYRGLVRIARDADSFCRHINAALNEPFSSAPGRARIAGHTWDAKAGHVLNALEMAGVQSRHCVASAEQAILADRDDHSAVVSVLSARHGQCATRGAA